jgi:hypothetical protein
MMIALKYVKKRCNLILCFCKMVDTDFVGMETL